MTPADLAIAWREKATELRCFGAEDQAFTLESRDPTGFPEAACSKPVGDGYDEEPLLTVEEVGEILRVPVKSVYDLPIKRVRIGQRRLRWRPVDVREFVNRRVENPA